MKEFDDPLCWPQYWLSGLRLLPVALCLVWGIVEYRTGSPLFGTGFTGAGLCLGWRFFVTYDPHRGEDP